MLRRHLGHLGDADVRKVCYENAAAVYRHPQPSERWLRDRVAGWPSVKDPAT
jgi:hypothetical protein